MHFRDDILRGVRLAAIVFALALFAMVLHRIVRVDTPGPATVSAKPVAAPKPAPQPPIIGGSASPGSIPPPPPVRANATPRKPAQGTLVRVGDSGEVVASEPATSLPTRPETAHPAPDLPSTQ
jgi:hypothetical protein